METLSMEGSQRRSILSLPLLEVELMETSRCQLRYVSQVRSLPLLEVELMETFKQKRGKGNVRGYRRFLYWKWN